MNESIAPWKCDIGDSVEFHFSRFAKEKGKSPIKGKVIGRPDPKLVDIYIENSEQTVQVHVSLVKVVEAALTCKRIKKVLTKKFNQTKNQRHATKKKKEVVKEVAGMTFKYNKK